MMDDKSFITDLLFQMMDAEGDEIPCLLRKTVSGAAEVSVACP